jgi:hypothetical protein
MSSSQVYSFIVSISKAGKFTIGPFKFKGKDKVYRTDSVNVNVISLNNDASSNNVNAKKTKDEDLQSLESQDKKNSYYILRISADKKEAYINEPVEITVKFFKRNDLQMIKPGTLNLPSNSWIENAYDPNESYAGITTINDIQYQEYVTERKRVYISRDSSYTISPVEFQFYGYSGSDFNAQVINLKSNQLSIRIKPLPSNPPKGFDGAVGVFKLSSSIDKTSCKVKEPLNLKIILEGKGNFQDIKDASYGMDGSFQIYSSKSDIAVNGGRNTKTWDILTVPDKSGKWKIKVSDFIYFDLAKKEYVKLKGNEYDINVGSEADKKNEGSVIINNDSVKNVVPNNDIGNIKTDPGNDIKLINYNVWFVIIIVIYIALIACLLLFFSTKMLVFNRYMHRDEINRKNSYKTFIRNIGELSERLKKNMTEGAMNSIYMFAENYFKSKFDMASIEFTSGGMQEKLGMYLDSGEIEELKSIFLKIDMQRFGGIDVTPEETAEIIKRVLELIKLVENRGVQ